MTPDNIHETFMREALAEARLAFEAGDVPVGAVMVRDGEIIARAHNRRHADKNALYHAEMLAIGAACRLLGGWRLPGCTLYVTLEPCVMCAGGIIMARVPELVYGCSDPKAGAFGGHVDVRGMGFNHDPGVLGGVLADECSAVLVEFFQKLREKNKNTPYG